MKQAVELLGAADKYQLEQLKSLCEEELCHTTNLENVVSHLIVGDLYQVKSRPSVLWIHYPDSDLDKIQI